MARETVRIEGLDQALRRLKALGVEAQKRGGPVAAAVREGGKLIAAEAKTNLQRIIDTPNIGGDNESTGKLLKSVRVMRAGANKELKGETYIVAPNRRSKYESGESVSKIGTMLEYGTGRRQPMPWMGPAFHAKKAEVLRVMKDKLLAGIEKLEKKLGRT